MNLTKEDIDALEEATKKATPGPWLIKGINYIDAACHYEVCQVTANEEALLNLEEAAKEIVESI